MAVFFRYWRFRAFDKLRLKARNDGKHALSDAYFGCFSLVMAGVSLSLSKANKHFMSLSTLEARVSA